MLRWLKAIKQTIDLVRKVLAQEREVASQLTIRQGHERLYVMARKQVDYWTTQTAHYAPAQARRAAKIAADNQEWLEERGYPLPVYPPLD